MVWRIGARVSAPTRRAELLDCASVSTRAIEAFILRPSMGGRRRRQSVAPSRPRPPPGANVSSAGPRLWVQALELGAERPDVGVDAEPIPCVVSVTTRRFWLESGHLFSPSAVTPATLRRSCCGCRLRHLWPLFEHASVLRGRKTGQRTLRTLEIQSLIQGA